MRVRVSVRVSQAAVGRGLWQWLLTVYWYVSRFLPRPEPIR